MSTHHNIATLRFDGPGFEGHALDVSALSEILRVREILTRVAEEVWREEHPGRERLAKGFREAIRLRIPAIQKGSAVVPLEAPSLGGKNLLHDDWLQTAAKRTYEAIRSQDKTAPLPKDFPKSAVPILADLGSSLGPKVKMSLAVERQKPTCITALKRVRFRRFVDENYSDSVDLVGEVRAADLDGAIFVLRMADGSKVEGRFLPDQEATIVEALREHASRRVRVVGIAEVAAGTNRMRRLTSISRVEFVSEDVVFPGPSENLVDMAARISRTISPAAWASVPTDLASRIDDHLYGKANGR